MTTLALFAVGTGHTNGGTNSQGGGCGRLSRICALEDAPAKIIGASYYGFEVKNSSLRRIVRFDLGCISPTGSSEIVYRSSVSATLDPGESFAQHTSDAPNTYVADCDKREAKMAVVSVAFSDGSLWEYRR